MKTVLCLLIQLAVSLLRLAKPGGAKMLMAETLMLKHQLLVLNRGRKRAPHLTPIDRLLLGLGTMFVSPSRISKVGIVVSPATLLNFHRSIVKRKYRKLFSPSKAKRKPGPKGPSKELITAIIEMKKLNPRFGCPRIAEQINQTFGVDINKDVVRRILTKHYKPAPGGGPSWLTFIGNMKDSLWSVDMFRCESILLKTYWVMVVMDQYSRRIIGIGVQKGNLDGKAICRIFNKAIEGSALPKSLSTDNDPLFQYVQWKANLRVLEVEEIKTVPHVPLSHPFVERLIGTIRREYLDQIFFWNTHDLERKLESFKTFYNHERTHSGIGGKTPRANTAKSKDNAISLNKYRWKKHCNELFQLPIAA